jgi:predicted Zn-dependent protease
VLNPGSSKEAAMVDRIGLRITKAITKYFESEGKGSVLDGYKWEFNTVESKDANAWCMPGGKVVVYTGILPLTQNETALAVVMGHEIAHAVAQHGNERMSQQMMIQMGGVALSEALKTKKETTQQIAMAAFGAGSALGVVLPYSRTHEYEADEMGLYFMAMAGYDPSNAPVFWERMIAQGGGAPPEFLSTHPDPANRIKDMKRKMPKALEYYQASK